MIRDHVLVVVADSDEPDNPDLYEYSVECPGPGKKCEAWTSCDNDACSTFTLDATGLDQPIQHGVVHRRIGDDWMVLAEGECYVAGHDQVAEAAPPGLKPGRYAINWTPGDDGTGLTIRPSLSPQR